MFRIPIVIRIKTVVGISRRRRSCGSAVLSMLRAFYGSPGTFFY